MEIFNNNLPFFRKWFDPGAELELQHRIQQQQQQLQVQQQALAAAAAAGFNPANLSVSNNISGLTSSLNVTPNNICGALSPSHAAAAVAANMLRAFSGSAGHLTSANTPSTRSSTGNSGGLVNATSSALNVSAVPNMSSSSQNSTSIGQAVGNPNNQGLTAGLGQASISASNQPAMAAAAAAVAAASQSLATQSSMSPTAVS